MRCAVMLMCVVAWCVRTRVGIVCGVCTAPRKKGTGEPGRVASPNVEGA